jgi:O-antigen ligase
MATFALRQPEAQGADSASAMPTAKRSRWILVLPLVFFAAHGAFSFQLAGYVTERGMPGVVEGRTRGLIGEVLIPGVVYAIVTWLLWNNRRLIASCARQFKMLTLLALLTVISAVWSQDPTRSALFGLFYLFGTLFAYYLVIRLDPDEIAALMVQTGTVVSVLSLILVFLFPKFGIMHGDPRIDGAWQGIFIDRANAAKCFLFLMSPALVSKGRSQRWRLLYIAAMSIMIFETRAVTAIVVLFIFVLLVAAWRTSRRLDRKLFVLASIVGTVSVLIVCVVGLNYGANVLHVLGRDATLSGRTDVWRVVTATILERPLLGYGYYAFWQTPSAELTNILHATNWSFGYAHNGILEIALQLGFLGVLMFGATLLRAAGDAWFCVRNDMNGRYDWFVGVIVLSILYNIDEATVVWPNELLSILYVVACCSLVRARSELDHAEQLVYL